MFLQAYCTVGLLAYCSVAKPSSNVWIEERGPRANHDLAVPPFLRSLINFTMSNRRVLQSTLQSFLRQERHNFLSPILLISSLPESSKVAEKSIDASLQKFQFYAQQEFGLPLICTQIPSAVCTKQDIDNVEKLKQRTGASVIIGMGSGAAIDLAKATCSAEHEENGDQLYLIPSTSAALLAAHTDMSLVLDTTEETIFMKKRTGNAATIVVDDNLVVHPHTLPACQAILLDAASRHGSTVDVSMSTNKTLLETIQYTADHLSTGLGDQPRSVPLCLASSLIPPVFSSTHFFTFWASLVPALLEAAELPIDLTAEHPSLASLALEAQSVDALLQHVRSNQFVSQAHDVNEDLLAEILASSLNR